MGCLNWLFFGIFILIYKAIKAVFQGIWVSILFLLQVISGVPLYYCKPEYLIPAKIIGGIGALLVISTLLSFIILFSEHNQHKDLPTFIIGFIIGALFLWCSRMLIRRGSI